MSTLAEEAAAAAAEVEAAEQAAREQERKAARAAATAAVKGLLVRPDGTALTLSEVGLKPVHDDAEVVVYSDGEVYLAASMTEPAVVLVAKEEDGTFTRMSDPLMDLADLGAALDGTDA